MRSLIPRCSNLLLIAVCVLGLGASASCDKKAELQAGPGVVSPKPDEFKSEDLVVGTGAEAKKDSAVAVHYTGTLKNGEKFDSSLDRGEPFEFTIGQGGVIRGWEKGVPGMKEGGKRRLTIPQDLGYGDKGHPPNIPPYATLIFEIELVKVK